MWLMDERRGASTSERNTRNINNFINKTTKLFFFNICSRLQGGNKQIEKKNNKQTVGFVTACVRERNEMAQTVRAGLQSPFPPEVPSGVSPVNVTPVMSPVNETLSGVSWCGAGHYGGGVPRASCCGARDAASWVRARAMTERWLFMVRSSARMSLTFTDACSELGGTA